MKTKKYCPRCKSLYVYRVKRNFIHKYILRISALYICGQCHARIRGKVLEKNTPVDTAG